MPSSLELSAWQGQRLSWTLQALGHPRMSVSPHLPEEKQAETSEGQVAGWAGTAAPNPQRVVTAQRLSCLPGEGCLG